MQLLRHTWSRRSTKHASHSRRNRRRWLRYASNYCDLSTSSSLWGDRQTPVCCGHEPALSLGVALDVGQPTEFNHCHQSSVAVHVTRLSCISTISSLQRKLTPKGIRLPISPTTLSPPSPDATAAAALPVFLRATQAPSGLADIWQAGRAAVLGALVSSAQHGTAQRCSAQHSMALHRHHRAQHSMAWHGTARHDTAWHGTAQAAPYISLGAVCFIAHAWQGFVKSHSSCRAASSKQQADKSVHSIAPDSDDSDQKRISNWAAAAVGQVLVEHCGPFMLVAW